jgi:hypothetical protein
MTLQRRLTAQGAATMAATKPGEEAAAVTPEPAAPDKGEKFVQIEVSRQVGGVYIPTAFRDADGNRQRGRRSNGFRAGTRVSVLWDEKAIGAEKLGLIRKV